jgi:hypothetical protein
MRRSEWLAGRPLRVRDPFKERVTVQKALLLSQDEM